MKIKEFTGKTTQEAIDNGLAELGVTIADVHVDGRGQTFAELPVGVGLAMIYVHTAAHTDPDVVEEAVRLVRTAHDLVVCVAVAVLLCHGNHRNEAHGYAQNSFDQYLLVHYFMY